MTGEDFPQGEANSETLRGEIDGKSWLLIGGSGTIGLSYIRTVLKYRPAKLLIYLYGTDLRVRTI